MAYLKKIGRARAREVEPRRGEEKMPLNYTISHGEGASPKRKSGGRFLGYRMT